MVYPDYYDDLLKDLKRGIDNKELYNKYSFNYNKGIKIRKNKKEDKVEIILIVWNKVKSIYNNHIDYLNNTLTYIGAGIESRQEIKRENKTLVNYFEEKWDIPIVFCSKIGKEVKYISTLKYSKKGYKIPGEDDSKIKFHFEMYNINIDNLNELSNIRTGKVIPWELKDNTRKKEQKASISKIISDDKLREIMKEFQFIGDIGELVALDYEYSRLQSIGLSSYIPKVEHTSFEKGHGHGYDIKSFDKKDEEIIEIYIEVKSTSLSESNEFYMSENEYKTMHDKGASYRIYRVYNIYESSNTVNIIKNPAENLTFRTKNKKQYISNSRQ